MHPQLFDCVDLKDQFGGIDVVANGIDLNEWLLGIHCWLKHVL